MPCCHNHNGSPFSALISRGAIQHTNSKHSTTRGKVVDHAIKELEESEEMCLLEGERDGGILHSLNVVSRFARVGNMSEFFQYTCESKMEKSA